MPKQAKCIVCGKRPAEVFKVCRECSKRADSTTGDPLPKKK